MGELVFQLACLHPHHCLYQIFSVKNGSRVSRKVRNQVETPWPLPGECGNVLRECCWLQDMFIPNSKDRENAATKLLGRLKDSSELLEQTVNQMEELLGAYLEVNPQLPPQPLLQHADATRGSGVAAERTGHAGLVRAQG